MNDINKDWYTLFNSFMVEAKFYDEKYKLDSEKEEIQSLIKKAERAADICAKAISENFKNIRDFNQIEGGRLSYATLFNPIPAGIKVYNFTVSVPSTKEIVEMWETIQSTLFRNFIPKECFFHYQLKERYGLYAIVQPEKGIKLTKDNPPEYSNFIISGQYVVSEEDFRDWRKSHPESILQKRQAETAETPKE